MAEDGRTLAARVVGDIAWINVLFAVRRLDQALKHNPNWRSQPRVPAGQSDGGRWAGGGAVADDGESGVTRDEVIASDAMNGTNPPVALIGSLPTTNTATARKESILRDTPAIFEVADNPSADGSKPTYELHQLHQVFDHAFTAVQESIAQKLDSKLVMAIIYMETTHGYYDKVHPWPRTLMPMNVHSSYWRDLGWTREELKDPEINIRAGVTLLKRIAARISKPSVAKIATVYNNLSARKVSDYGARVQVIYDNELWWKF
ncbi:hypothetical protein [Nitratireductor soli]|uniref:hypothetical protein n=1 Tax=Nitratireductor soli TaxID=1670619 RepID=UPI00065E2104|nr:hypothetical protein [Nitratireductor soli]